MANYKYIKLSENIRKMISEGKFPTGKLPSEQEFMQHFKVGKITVYNALQLLVEEGILCRIKSKGTFINAEGGKSVTINSLIPTIMPEHSHYIDKISAKLRISLLENDLLTVPIDCSIKYLKELSGEPLRKQLFLLLNSNINSIIYDGVEYFKLPFLEKYPKIRSVAFRVFDAPGPIPDRAVLLDFEDAIYQATLHLAKQGLQKIVLFNYCPEPYPKDKQHLHRTVHYQNEQGYKLAMRECGLEQNIEIIYRGHHAEMMLRGLITRPDRPEGIVCDMDSDASTVIKLAMEHGIKVPADLKVTGMYNTPWSDDSAVKITTIEFSPEEIAEKITEMITSDKVSEKIAMISPKLLVKDSS